MYLPDSTTALLSINKLLTYLSSNQQICNGDSIKIGDNFYSANGMYNDTITSINIDTVFTTNLIVKTVDVGVTTSGVTITADSISNAYQWLDCNNEFAIIADETSQSYTAIANGNYAVMITQGLCSDTSACVQITTVGIKTIQTKKISIYPNPVTNELIIEFENNTNETDFEILNSIGQVVFKGSLVKKTTVHTSNFTTGVYLIKLENGKTFEFKKIVKE